LIPGCVLVQPLDEAKPDNDGSGAGGPHAGSGNGNSGGPSKAGSGNAGRGGGSSAGGAPNGGAPSGDDFSLFTGSWYVSGGTITTRCEGETPMTSSATLGGEVQVGLGTTSDLIFDPGTNCEILADVDERSASLNWDTLPCTENDGTYNYYLDTEYLDFTVSDDDQSATASIITSVTTTDADDNLLLTCEVEQSLEYER
jgi:hypothetical protein